MKILCTFPGKYGDLLWALPAIRALSRRVGARVDLQIAGAFGSIADLLQVQPYIGVILVDTGWAVQETAPMTPRIPPGPDALRGYDHVFHLGHRAWPQRPLPFETLDCLSDQWGWNGLDGDPPADADLHLEEPWITVEERHAGFYWPWNYGFTDEHFELKYGLVSLLSRESRRAQRTHLPPCGIGMSARWQAEAGIVSCTWNESAALLQHTGVLLACNSALHVLAVAVGVPVVLMEPNPHRHHEIFYPLGDIGPQVTLVRGNDGRPTFDARHVYTVLQNVLTQTHTR